MGTIAQPQAAVNTLHDADLVEDQPPPQAKLEDFQEWRTVPPHRIDPNLAREFGLLPAALFEFFLRASPWMGTMTKLRGRRIGFFYASHWQLRQALRQLEGTVVNIERDPGRGIVVTLRPGIWRQYSVKRTYHRFDPCIAWHCEGNITAALIHWQTLWYVVQRGIADTELFGQYVHVESAARWQRHHPYAKLRTVQHAYDALIKAGLLERDCDPGGKQYCEDRNHLWHLVDQIGYVGNRWQVIREWGKRKK